MNLLRFAFAKVIVLSALIGGVSVVAVGCGADTEAQQEACDQALLACGGVSVEKLCQDDSACTVDGAPFQCASGCFFPAGKTVTVDLAQGHPTAKLVDVGVSIMTQAPNGHGELPISVLKIELDGVAADLSLDNGSAFGFSKHQGIPKKLTIKATNDDGVNATVGLEDTPCERKAGEMCPIEDD